MTFPDGKRLVAEVNGTDRQPQLVRYSGVVNRLRTKPTEASPGFLEWYLQAVGAMCNATLDVERSPEEKDRATAERPAAMA